MTALPSISDSRHAHTVDLDQCVAQGRMEDGDVKRGTRKNILANFWIAPGRKPGSRCNAAHPCFDFSKKPDVSCSMVPLLHGANPWIRTRSLRLLTASSPHPMKHGPCPAPSKKWGRTILRPCGIASLTSSPPRNTISGIALRRDSAPDDQWIDVEQKCETRDADHPERQIANLPVEIRASLPQRTRAAEQSRAQKSQNRNGCRAEEQEFNQCAGLSRRRLTDTPSSQCSESPGLSIPRIGSTDPLQSSKTTAAKTLDSSCGDAQDNPPLQG